jgi:hypothetical protein
LKRVWSIGDEPTEFPHRRKLIFRATHLKASLNRKHIRKAHRWLGLVAAVQLLIWTATGLYFAVMPIDDIRGSHLLKEASSYQLSHLKLISPSDLLQAHPQLESVRVDKIIVAQRHHRAIYNFSVDGVSTSFDAETGEKLGLLNESEAQSILQSRTDRAILRLDLIQNVPAGDEYRNGELPAWRADVSGSEDAVIYLGAQSGKLRAVRTNNWRIYDFLWGLHIMDYEDRDDFNHLLLQAFALLGVITVLSGMTLFVTSTQWFARKFATKKREL